MANKGKGVGCDCPKIMGKVGKEGVEPWLAEFKGKRVESWNGVAFSQHVKDPRPCFLVLEISGYWDDSGTIRRHLRRIYLIKFMSYIIFFCVSKYMDLYPLLVPEYNFFIYYLLSFFPFLYLHSFP